MRTHVYLLPEIKKLARVKNVAKKYERLFMTYDAEALTNDGFI